ncbi:MAG: 4-(cytidine 5'-diphospho)-2-C-methyl-D-erythritol kinase, partial [Gemmatimonadota bacterium]
GAGLGGGSSDAATVLRALNELYDGVLPDTDLFAIAARLGSDVAFFLCGSPLAQATGRGEMLKALPALPRAPIIIIAPDFTIATADAYRWLDDDRAFSSTRQVIRTTPRDWNDVALHATNDFERVVFPRHARLAAYRDALQQSGARIALLSGSGSTVFGVYDSAGARDGAAARLEGTVRASGAAVVCTHSRVV